MNHEEEGDNEDSVVILKNYQYKEKNKSKEKKKKPKNLESPISIDVEESELKSKIIKKRTGRKRIAEPLPEITEENDSFVIDYDDLIDSQFEDSYAADNALDDLRNRRNNTPNTSKDKLISKNIEPEVKIKKGRKRLKRLHK